MQGIAVLAVYAAVVIGGTFLLTKRERNVKSYLVADRNMGAVSSGVSIAAAWVWAPALFVSAERAYLTGLAGMFWFLVPNVLCLLLFIPFAKRIRQKMPEGVTLSGYMGDVYNSRKVKGVYLFQLAGLSVCSVGVQLLAGAKMLSLMTGLPYVATVIALAVIAFIYSQRAGIRAVLVSNNLQMAFLLVAGAIIVPWLASRTGGVATLSAGLPGVSGNYRHLFTEGGREVFFSFGLSSAIGLMSGPFGDQTFWQRAFSIKEKSIGKAFALGAFLFALVPLFMGAVGFLAAGSGFVANDTSVVNIEFITAMLPQWVSVLLIFMVLSGLLSTIDNNLCSISALMTDIAPGGGVKRSKIGMLALLATGIGIAFIPGMSVTRLFLIYGTLRATTMLPTVLTLLGRKLKANAVFAGVLSGMLLGLPVFAFGALADLAICKTLGSLVSLLTPAAVALAVSRKGAKVCR